MHPSGALQYSVIAKDLQSDALRTTALVEFQLEIAVQRHRSDVLSILARTARHVVPSARSAVIMFEPDNGVHVSTASGMTFASDSDLPPGCKAHLAALSRTSKTERVSGKNCSLMFGAAASYLGVPIVTIGKTHGWLCLIDRIGAAQYSDEDERLAQTIAAQTAMAYENLQLVEQLRDEAALLRATIEAGTDGIVVVDRAAHFVTFNQRFLNIWRLPDEIIRSGNDAHAIEHQRKQLKHPQSFRVAIERTVHDPACEASGTCELLDGRTIEWHSAPHVVSGHVTGRVLRYRDVTAAVAAERALRNSEEKYRSLVTHIPDVTWTRDSDANVTFVSPNVETLIGYTPAEVCADTRATWTDRIHDDDRDVVLEQFADFLDGRRIFDCEYRLQRRDGRWIWVHGWSVNTYERDGRRYADGVLNDITARKESESQLRLLARDRELLLESTGDGIYAVDDEGRCTMANRAAATLLGMRVEEMVGCHAHDLVHHSRADGSAYPEAECPISAAFRSGKISRVVDEVFWRKDGTSFPVEYLASPLLDEGHLRGAVVTFADVTEKRKLERRLDQAGRVSSLGRMAATIAHEFNNVLMGIQPFAELMRRSDVLKVQQAAGQILNSVERGKTITHDILRMTRTPDPVLQSVDIAAWLEPIAAEIRARIGSHIDIRIDAPQQQTLFARCDPAQLQQVVMNLALNARDAMDTGGTLTISAMRGETVRLLIADTGTGIAPDTLPFIFEPLFTTKRSGTGLGLAVAQQLVVRNGGSIAVESAPGVGTRFSIELPTGQQVDPPESVRLMPRELGVRRVLIVEDDEAVAAGMTMLLEREDVEVRVVGTGGEACDAVAEFEPDVVILDISLPDMSGNDVYDAIIERWPGKPVIFSTGHADESCVPASDRKHVAFLRKPYGSDELIAALREVL